MEIGPDLISVFTTKGGSECRSEWVFSPYRDTAVPAEDPGPLSLQGGVSITKDGNMLWSGPSMQSLVHPLLQVAATHLFQPEIKHHGVWSPMLR